MKTFQCLINLWYIDDLFIQVYNQSQSAALNNGNRGITYY